MHQAVRKWGAVAVVAATTIYGGLSAIAGEQKLSPAEAATKLTGTWVINRELTSGFGASGRRGGGGGGRGASFNLAGSVRPTFAPAFGQRGAGAGPSTASDASDISAAERAAMMAMRELQQIAETITIKATADQVLFEDARGQRTYALDGKGVKLTVADAEVNAKSRWDKAVLKQEFTTTSSKLTETWEVDENGRLVLFAKVESLRLRTPDQRAIFDRKPTP